MRRKTLGLAVLCVALAGLLVSCAGGSQAGPTDRSGWPSSVTFGGPSVGSATHLVVTAFGTMVEKYLSVGWSYQPGVASIAGAELMGQGKIDVNSATVPDALYFAPRGTGPMEGKKVTNIRLLFPVLVQGYHIFARTQDNIKTVEALKGKRFTWQSTSWLSTTFSEHLLGAAGLNWDAVQKAPATQQGAATQMMSDRKTDIMLWVGNTLVAEPTYQEMDRLVGVSLVPLTEAQQNYILKQMPYLGKGQLAAGGYKGQDKPVPTISWTNSFTIRKEAPETLVYELMKVAFDRNDEFRASHPLLNILTPNWALSATTPAPWHAGAVRYWKEKGMWKKEHDDRQKALLSELGAES